MPDRSVVVRMRAEIAGFKQSMADAAKAVRGVSDASGDAEEQTSGLVDRMRHSAEEHQAAWEKVGKTMLITGGVIGAGVGLAVKSFAEFDKEMSLVRAVSGATSAEMEKLSAAALQAGADTKFSASEAAQATGELAKVGISTADILGGALRGSLDLAAAGNLDLANAAEISGQAMKLFGLQGKDVGHIADVLAAGANKSAADVTDLAQALSQGGLVAAQTGLNLDQTVGTLSAFADNALMGSDAGTSFKTMLQRLNPQSEQAKKLMEQLGLSAYDAQGTFVGIANYAGQLQDALGKMSTEQRNAAMQTLFGSDAVRAATVLYNLGAKGVQGYVDAVNDQGAATRNAAINMDNLAGDIEQLKGSIETGLIEAGSGANDSLRTLVQSGTAAVNFASALPGPLLQVGLGLAAVTSAALITGGAVSMVAAKAAAARATMLELGITTQATAARMTSAAKGAGILAAAIVGVSAAGAAFDTFIARQAAGTNEAGASLLAYAKAGREAKGVTDLTSSGFKDLDKSINLALRSGAWSATKEFFADFATLSIVPTGMDESKEFFKEMDSGLANLVSSGHADEAQKVFDQVAAAAQKQGYSIAQVNDLLPSYSGALKTAQESAAGAVPPTEQLGGSIDGVQVSAKDAADAIDTLVQSLADAGLVQLSTRDAARQYQQAIADARKEAEKGAKTLDVHTAEGRKNQAAMDGQAEAAIRQAQAIYESTKSTEGTGPAEAAFRASLEKSRGALVTTARRFGMTKAEAEAYADQVLNIPNVKNTKVTLSGADAAITRASQIAVAIAKIPGRKTTDVVVRKIGAQLDSLNSADGGFISGPGGPRSDSIPAMLSDGEFVINAAATARHRPLLEHLNAQKFAEGGYVQHFATGGSVSSRIDAQYQKAIRLPGAEGVKAASDAITRLLDAWQKSIDDADTAARRLELVRAVAKASRKDVAAARKELADFDRDQTRERIKSAAARKQELLASRAQALQDRQDAADKQASDLNRMLDDRASLLDQLSKAQATYDSTVAATNARLADQSAQLKAARVAELAGWADLTKQVTVGFAPSMNFLVNNAKDQVEQFTEWMSQLAMARSRGLSESAIASLGLDQGPQALAQLRMVNKGTADQVDQLNALVAERTGLAQQEADREATGRLGKLGQDLLALQQEATDAIAQAQADFLEQQQSLTEQLAQVGTDQARSYTDAIAQGLISGIPAIEAAAAQVQAALVKLGQMQAALTAATKKASTTRSKKASGGWIVGPGSGTSDEVPLWGSNGEFMVNARDAARNASLLTAINSGRTVTASGASTMPAVNVTSAAPQVHVYVDGQEFRGLVRVELGQVQRAAGFRARRTVGQ